MKIAIDCRRISGEFAGLGSYTLNLVKGLAKIDASNEYLLFINPQGIKHLASIGDNFEIIEVKHDIEEHLRSDPWKNLKLPGILSRQGVDCFLDPAYHLPIIDRARHGMAVTIHDLAHYLKPRTNTIRYNSYMRLITRLSIAKAKAIITDSEFIRGEILQRFNIKPQRVHAVHLAISDDFRQLPEEIVKPVLEKYEVSGDYILCATNMEPRKNIENLVKAYDILRVRCKASIRLVLAGKLGWMMEGLVKQIYDSGLKEHILMTGYVSRSDLIALHNGALFFVFPSFYEGFGLPPLEAMACGKAVAASDRSSLPEVLGDAALYFDPTSPDDMADRLYELSTNADLRGELEGKSLLRAKAFSWHRCAKETLAILEGMVT